MLKLLPKMRRKEALMCLACAVLVLGQIYFDLTLPEYMSDLTVLINTPGSQMSDIWRTGGRMLVCTLASAILTVVCSYLSSKAASGFSFTLRAKVFHHVMELGQQDLLEFSIPSLITRTTNDITQLQMLVAMGLQIMVKAPIMAVWAVIKILGKSWELSMVTAAFVCALLVLVSVVVVTVVPRFRLVQKLTDQINRVVRENLAGIHVVHAFHAEDYQNEKFDVVNTSMMKVQLFNQRMFSLMMPLIGLAMNGLSLTIYWLGAALLNGIPMTEPMGRLTMFSNIVVFSTYATYVVMSIMMMVMIFMMLPAAQVSAERLNQVLKTSASIREGAVSQMPEVGTVEFRHVSFRYPGAAEDSLSDVSFRVEQGQTLAIIGATGSGKTTLVNLIARFYDVTEGEVLVDGVNVKACSFQGLYDRLGYVAQKAVLFAGSIRDNICFGQAKEPIREEDVRRAVAIAQAAEFVNQQPEGVDYRIAQAGKNVSGGQKQRLSIARALARKPEILIFDDSFSALDYRTDAALRSGLKRELSGTTQIIVAQRISTIRHADQILVLDRGRLVGKGTHGELMGSCPVYREIAMSQLSAAELA